MLVYCNGVPPDHDALQRTRQMDRPLQRFNRFEMSG
jgi:hypothetical protein